MKTITQLADYCREINVPAPRYEGFDIRKFEDNMRTVNAVQSPFKHEFYAIALRKAGSNREVNGQFLESNLFFNSPYQVISWDIRPDWEGWYIIFGRDFLAKSPLWQNFIIDYPFFRLDKAMPMNISPADERMADEWFRLIFEEYHSDNPDKFLFIEAYTQLLLLITKRHFTRLPAESIGTANSRTADILLVARFQSFTESMTGNEESGPEVRQPSFYAEKLHVHPNHLNAVVKRITGKTATALIHQQIMTSARFLLHQTNLSIKEIAFRLHFQEPTHFTSFFRKLAGLSPQQYRDKHKC